MAMMPFLSADIEGREKIMDCERGRHHPKRAVKLLRRLKLNVGGKARRLTERLSNNQTSLVEDEVEEQATLPGRLF